jgi:hypothetical protein
MKNNITKHTLLTVCLLLAFSGCRDKAVPNGVVDTATLARFLTEAHIIDSYDYTVASKNRDSLQHDVNAAYDSLYSKYGITKADYDTTIDYYLQHPKMLEDVYARVVINLKEYTNEKMHERYIADSIAGVNNPDSSDTDTPAGSKLENTRKPANPFVKTDLSKAIKNRQH